MINKIMFRNDLFIGSSGMYVYIINKIETFGDTKLTKCKVLLLPRELTLLVVGSPYSILIFY